MSHFNLKMLAWDGNRELENSLAHFHDDLEMAKWVANDWWRNNHIGKKKHLILSNGTWMKRSNRIKEHKNF
jgi:hypothetical protein